MFTKFSFILIFAIFIFSSTNAQRPKCITEYNGIAYQFPRFSSFPPLTTDIPLEVIIAYKTIDSLCRSNLKLPDWENFIKNQSYNDTLKYLMKYFQYITDYNGFKFYQYIKTEPNGGLLADDIEWKVIKQVGKVTPVSDRMSTYSVIKSYFIYHIYVTDTMRYHNPDAAICQNQALVECTVLDTIKGKFIPECTGAFSRDKIGKIRNTPQSNSGACLQFEYCCEWERGRSQQFLSDTAGNAWVKKEKEYVVFLSPRYICRDSINCYFSLTPAINESYVFSMYPIIQGFVSDPKNEFGLGTSVPLNDFKNKIRFIISEIKNY